MLITIVIVGWVKSTVINESYMAGPKALPLIPIYLDKTLVRIWELEFRYKAVWQKEERLMMSLGGVIIYGVFLVKKEMVLKGMDMN